MSSILAKADPVTVRLWGRRIRHPVLPASCFPAPGGHLDNRRQRMLRNQYCLCECLLAQLGARRLERANGGCGARLRRQRAFGGPQCRTCFTTGQEFRRGPISSRRATSSHCRRCHLIRRPRQEFGIAYTDRCERAVRDFAVAHDLEAVVGRHRTRIPFWRVGAHTADRPSDSAGRIDVLAQAGNWDQCALVGTVRDPCRTGPSRRCRPFDVVRHPRRSGVAGDSVAKSWPHGHEDGDPEAAKPVHLPAGLDLPLRR